MPQSEQLREALKREALAPLQVAKILVELDTNNARLRVLRCLTKIVEADQEEPGVLDIYAKGRAA